MKLTIIIVNFNTLPFLEKCLDSLWAHYSAQLKNEEYRIIVVDNASIEDPSILLRRKFPRGQLVKSRENLGFAKANNLGIQKAQGVYILLLNPDTRVLPDTLATMVEFMDRNTKVAVATCRVNLTDGQIDDASHRGFPTPWRALTYFSGLSKLFPHSFFFNGYHLGYKDMDKPHEIDACVGAFMLIRSSVGKKLKWLDEDYFWYGEDLDFCYRVKENGFSVMYVPTVSIIHQKGMASGIKNHSQHLSLADYETKKRATGARFEAMRIFYKKHYRYIYPNWLTQLVLFGINIKQKTTNLTL